MSGGLSRPRRWPCRESRDSRNQERRMSISDFTKPAPLNRRSFLKLGTAGLTLSPTFFGASLPGQKENKQEKGPGKGPKGTVGATHFLLACMTLPYHDFPLERA